jgi:membrane fusion protein, multidrug efflux system
MRKPRISALVFAAVTASSAHWLPRVEAVPVHSAEVGRPLPIVEVANARQQDMPVYVRGIGRVEPFKSVDIKSRIDGPIERVLFTEGTEVKAGTALFEIDPRPYRAIVTQIEGQLARDQAKLATAQTDYARLSSLVTNGTVARQSFDQQGSLVEQLSAEIRIDRAALDNGRLTLSFTTIRAPFDGRIGKRLADIGTLIHSADGTALAQIVQLQPISVILTVPQDALPEIIHRQQMGELKMQALATNDRQVLSEGVVVLIANSIERQTGTIELKGVFNNADRALWPGQLVNGRVVTQIRKDAVSVPTEAIQVGPAGRFVYVVEQNDVVAMRPVKLGASVPGLAVIESGLRVGEKVVIDGQEKLTPGTTVRISRSDVDGADQRASSDKAREGHRS